MAVVGDFTPSETTDPEADPDEFTYFGETFEIPATIGAGALLRFAYLMKAAISQGQRGEQAKRKAKTEDARIRASQSIIESDLTASSAMYELLQACLGAEQVETFIQVADAGGVTQDALMDVCDRIQGVIAGRPTRRSSDSSDGPSTTGPASTGDGFGPTDTPLELTPREQQIADLEDSTEV